MFTRFSESDRYKRVIKRSSINLNVFNRNIFKEHVFCVFEKPSSESLKQDENERLRRFFIAFFRLLRFILEVNTIVHGHSQ